MILDIIKKPIITEKTTALAGQNLYVFQVALTADKPAIKQAIEKLYEVKVIQVRTARRVGKKQYLWRYRRTVSQPETKRAYVRLAAGQKIGLFEAPEDSKKTKKKVVKK